MHRILCGSALAGLVFGLAGCTTLDELSVAETHRLDEGEFYVDTGTGGRGPFGPTLVLPVLLDPELATTLEYGGRADEFAPIIEALNAALQGQSCCRLAASSGLPGGAPQIYLGSADSERAPPQAQDQRLPHDRFAPMVIHVQKPSDGWQRAVSELLAREQADYAVVLTLGVSQYPKGREGVFAKKVTLGTGHEQPIRFLTAEDKLLEVLQIEGVIVDRQGRIVRAGAEGVIARDTPFAAQVIDVGRSIDDRSLEKVLTTERRDDLPGSPLNLDIALANLVAQLRRDPSAVIVP